MFNSYCGLLLPSGKTYCLVPESPLVGKSGVPVATGAKIFSL
jgi:hypothetical protein